MDITTLNTEASTGALRKKDPFMYYSAFKPTSNPAREAANHVVEMQRSGNDGHSSVMVERKTRISVKCDVLTAVQEMFELNDGGVETFQEAFELVQHQVMPDKEQSGFLATLDLYIGVFGISAAAKT